MATLHAKGIIHHIGRGCGRLCARFDRTTPTTRAGRVDRQPPTTGLGR